MVKEKGKRECEGKSVRGAKKEEERKVMRRRRRRMAGLRENNTIKHSGRWVDDVTIPVNHSSGIEFPWDRSSFESSPLTQYEARASS